MITGKKNQIMVIIAVLAIFVLLMITIDLSEIQSNNAITTSNDTEMKYGSIQPKARLIINIDKGPSNGMSISRNSTNDTIHTYTNTSTNYQDHEMNIERDDVSNNEKTLLSLPPTKHDQRIHIVYAVENLINEEQLQHVDTRSTQHSFVNEVTYILRQSLLSLSITTSKQRLNNLTVHIFCRDDRASDMAVLKSLIDELYRSSNLRDIRLELFDMNIVTKERKVWGQYSKLEAPANYLRFYFADILGKQGIKKILYVDYDVMFVNSIHTIFEDYANGDVAIAAGEQKKENCWAGKIISMTDSRLSNSPLKEDDPCMAGAALLINTENWIRQDRTKRLEAWLKSNKEEKLWTLGSLPPLMIEFAGEYNPFPAYVIADNKGYKEGSLLYQLKRENKNMIMLHPTKLRNFVEESIVWFQVVISTEDDLAMISHLLASYKDLKIPPLNFLVILHHQRNDAPELWEATRLTKSFGIFNILHWIGEYSSDMMNRNRQKIRQLAGVRDKDWIIHADSDQIHEFPTNDAPFFLRSVVSKSGYDSVYGYYIDRLTEDGSIRNITSDKSLSAQFPLACHVSTQVVKLSRDSKERNIPSKIMAYRGYLRENRGGGTLDNDVIQKTCAYPTRLRTNHYKWTWAVLRKMKMRAVIERNADWGYQNTNVIDHLKKNDGKINIGDERLKCRRVYDEMDMAPAEILPTSSKPVDLCDKYRYIDEEIQRLDD